MIKLRLRKFISLWLHYTAIETVAASHAQVIIEQTMAVTVPPLPTSPEIMGALNPHEKDKIPKKTP